MKVVAINTSPEKGHGVISILLDPFLDGLRKSGADVELYYSRDLLIFPCCGNLNCTVRTPGQCMAYDDMRWLRLKIGQADVLVLASPLYFNGHTGAAGVTEPMKRLEARLIMCQSLSGEPYEHAVHTTREPVNLHKVVIVSGCGFIELDDFYPVLTHMKALCYNSFPELAGCITGPVGTTVRGALPEGASEREIVDMARVAGQELAQTCERISRPAPLMACDGRTKASDSRREWEGEILYKF